MRIAERAWAFAHEAVELIGGQLFVAEPQGTYHASLVGAVGDALRAVLPAGWIIRIQAPVALDDEVRACFTASMATKVSGGTGRRTQSSRPTRA